MPSIYHVIGQTEIKRKDANKKKAE